MSKRFDAIVIGCGGVGSATLEQLSARGLRVLGIEQFQLGHSLGSSHGRTRIIRQAYFEHPNYVPLLHESYDVWRDLEQRTNRSLYVRTGLLEVGPPNGELVQGIRQSVAEHGLRVDEFTATEARRQFSDFHFDDHCVAIFEHDAGYLKVDECVETQLELSRRQGATLIDQSPVVSWNATDNSVTVRTSSDSFAADSLVITTGAWSASVCATQDSLAQSLPIQVLKKHVHWFRPTESSFDIERGTPIFYFETNDGHYYGFPALDEHGVKVAEHSGGEVVLDASTVNREIDPVDLQRIEGFIDRWLTSSRFQHHDHSVCFYSMTPDGHFIVDRHPDAHNVLVTAGLSGHGFKFTRLLGKLIADAITSEIWDPRIAFLGLNRFSGSEGS